VAKRFELTYAAADGSDKTPYIIHRAPLSTHERLVSFLIEHYGGAFPTWLAPEQVRVLPIAETFSGYADKVVGELRRRMIRASADHSDATLGKKIRNGAGRKTPIMVVCGEKEAASEEVTLRRHGIKEQRTLKLAEFLVLIEREIRDRIHVRSWDDLDS
jgi:threonyl-tRNA synthetase